MVVEIVKFQVCEKYLIAHNSLLRARRELLRSRQDFEFFFIFFNLKPYFFDKIVLKTFLNLSLEERSFVTIIIFCRFALRKSALKFQNIKIKLLINFDLISADSF